MKKKLLAAVLCGAMALSLVACGGSGTGNGTSEKPLRKVTKQINYTPSTGEKQNETETHYDKNGRETYKKFTSYNTGANRDETMTTETTYNWVENGDTVTADLLGGNSETITYDKDGNVIKRLTKTMIGHTEYVYTYKNGVQATMVMTTVQSDTVLTVLEASFDERGNLAKYVYKDSTGKVMYSYDQTYEYDKAGKILSSTMKVLGTDGQSQDVKYDYVYDANGFLDKIEVDGTLTTDYTCDSKGNTIEIKSYTSGLLTSETHYEYYEN